jgi:putative Holliday junction resolvase
MAKILAVDWGKAKLGLAVSDDLGITAQGLSSLPRVSESKDIDAIGAYIRDLRIEAVVVGLPKNMDGTLGPSAEAAQAFAGALRARLGIPVHLWDERLTSLAAERTLVGAGIRRRERRGMRDKVAAIMILQGFLDRQRVTVEQEDS